MDIPFPSENAEAVNEAYRRGGALLYRLLLPRDIRFVSVTVTRNSLSYPPRGDVVIDSIDRRRERCARLCAFEMPARGFAGRPARADRFFAESRDNARRSFVRPSVRLFGFIVSRSTCALGKLFLLVHLGRARARACVVSLRMCVYVCVCTGGGWSVPDFRASGNSDISRHTDKIRNAPSGAPVFQDVSSVIRYGTQLHHPFPTFFLFSPLFTSFFEDSVLRYF